MALVTALIVWVIATRLADAGDLKHALLTADWSLVGVAVGFMGLGLAAATFRFRVVLAAMGFDVPARDIFAAMMAAWPLAVITPSRVNELLRAWILKKHVPVVECSGGVLAERVVDVQTLCLLAAAGSAVAGSWFWFGVSMAGWLAVWVGAALVLFSTDWFVSLPVVNKLEDKFRKLVRALGALRESPRHLLGVMAGSLVVWLCAVAIVHTLLLAFGSTVSVVTTFSLWPLAIFVGLLPLTVSGLGTRDAAFLGLLALVGVQVEPARVFSATMGYAVVGVLLPAIAGIPWFLRHFSAFSTESDDD